MFQEINRNVIKLTKEKQTTEKKQVTKIKHKDSNSEKEVDKTRDYFDKTDVK